MATKFLEPGGDAGYNVAITTAGGFWRLVQTGTALATDFVHGNHGKSIRFGTTGSWRCYSPLGILRNAGSRISFYQYNVGFAAGTTGYFLSVKDSGDSAIFYLKLTAAGVLQLFDGTPTQLGSDGPTLVTGQWYRVSIAYTLTSTTVNRVEVFVNGVSAISVTNATIARIGADNFTVGGLAGEGAQDFRASDFYVDDSASLTDTGDVWVTAKRPNANGSANNFNSQIGAGGSGYGSGHSPQVNERALSNTNGWSVVAAGVTTEEYNIEGKSVGDIDISTATIVDYMGWVDAKALLSETASLVLNGAASNIALTSTETLFTSAAGSTSYPAGTGADIGITTTSLATTVSLFECGIIVAYIPAVLSPATSDNPTFASRSVPIFYPQQRQMQT